MEVSRPTPLGMMPFSRVAGAVDLAAPAHAAPLHACGGAGSCRSCSGGGGGSPGVSTAAIQTLAAAAPPVTIRGARDGPDITLSNGIKVRRMAVGNARVTERELHEAIRGILVLPVADQRLIARAGIPVELVPTAALEGGILGATTILQSSAGGWSPSLVRVAVRSPLSNQGTGRERIGEIVQHELGHVRAVLLGQDRSEHAAERYALMH
ncbi:MAG: hypothetical protein JWM25_1416 [Thermoleophilia bacterium]|nr:hypothetical protein [Thermoleophilia bacterium]MCZ4496833.1 hypothetical protein [Thermoleophilia bacterium]